MKKIHIPAASPANKSRLSELALACADAAMKNDVGTVVILETEINQIVYRLFDLTAKEIAVIEAAVNP